MDAACCSCADEDHRRPRQSEHRASEIQSGFTAGLDQVGTVSLHYDCAEKGAELGL